MISNQFRRSGWVTSLSPTLYLAPFSLTGIIWNARKNITWIRGKTVSFVLSLKKELVIKTFDCLTMKPFEIFYTENKFQLYKIRQAKATLDSYISCNTAIPFVLQRINRLTLCPRHISLKRFELCNYKYNG